MRLIKNLSGWKRILCQGSTTKYAELKSKYLTPVLLCQISIEDGMKIGGQLSPKQRGYFHRNIRCIITASQHADFFDFYCLNERGGKNLKIKVH